MKGKNVDALNLMLAFVVATGAGIVYTSSPADANVTQMNVMGDDGHVWAVQVHGGCDFLYHTKSDCGGWYKADEGKKIHLVMNEWNTPIQMRNNCNHEVMHYRLFWEEHNIFIGDGHHKIMAERGIPETKVCRLAVFKRFGVWV